MTFRKIFFWLHLLAGIITGIVVMIMSVTGIALTYQKQITDWADKKICMINPAPGTRHLPVEDIAAVFFKSRPDVQSFTLSISSDPQMPAGASISRFETILINPYNAEILGTGSEKARLFFQTMTNWHRWLALSRENLGTGRAVTGACNLAFLFLVISGIYLWWPRRWTRRILRSVAWFRLGLSPKARDFNWHNVFGIWFTIPLVLIVISAVVISYPWATNLLYRLSGSEISSSGSPKSRPTENPIKDLSLKLEGIDLMLAKIKNDAGEWRSISFQIPPASNDRAEFAVNMGYGGQPQLRTTFTANISNAEIISRSRFKDLDPGLRARLWMRFVHTGEYYGLPGQTIAGIASIAAVILVWTGIALSFRRYASWNRRRLRGKTGQAVS
jgi:uncharacterized iron-regulated membrane protein